MLWSQIGQTAGMVYRLLAEKREITIEDLMKDLKVPEDILQMALGWLAREDRVRFDLTRNSLKISLK
jgi:hypothetical protein